MVTSKTTRGSSPGSHGGVRTTSIARMRGTTWQACSSIRSSSPCIPSWATRAVASGFARMGMLLVLDVRGSFVTNWASQALGTYYAEPASRAIVLRHLPSGDARGGEPRLQKNHREYAQSPLGDNALTCFKEPAAPAASHRYRAGGSAGDRAAGCPGLARTQSTRESADSRPNEAAGEHPFLDTPR